jgi:cytokinin dehydrogenase
MGAGMKQAKWSSNFIELIKKETDIPLTQAVGSLNNAAIDFGHLVKGSCYAVASPHTTMHIQTLMQFVNQHYLPITLRGRGLSQSGQSVTPEGAIAIDLSHLQQVDSIDQNNQSVRCEAGVTWRGILEQTLPHGFIPPVLPLNLDLTVGGTLSIGGIGASSHHFGPIVDNVLALQVVTGDGQYLNCDANNESALFKATLGGLGRCSVLATATLALRKCKPRVRTFYLLYDDHQAWLEDQLQITEHNQGDYLEAFCSASLQGLRNTAAGRKPFAHWFYPLQISVEYDDEAPEAIAVLQGLRYWKLIHREDADIFDYVNRYEPRFAFMHKSGAWDLPHPWTECLLPVDIMPTLLPQILAETPLSLGDGHRVLYVNNQNKNSSLFMHPANSEKCSLIFAILPVGIPPFALADSLAALQRINHLLIEAGGKRYPSGWLGTMDEAAWQKHYGDRYAEWMAVKAKFDPNKVIRSVLFPT